LADIHGQYRFSFRHAAISRDDSKRLLDGAFRHDFDRNGPSIYRICRTIFEGWRRYKDDPDRRIRTRFGLEAGALRHGYAAALWAMEVDLRKKNPPVSRDIHALRKEIEHEFGILPRLAAASLGPFLLWTTRREAGRLAKGRTYEPRPIVERRNWEARDDLPDQRRRLGSVSVAALS
jgi:hypothetical protein